MTDLGKVMGSRILSGTTAPLVALGLDDDWYLNTTNGFMYQKVVAIWTYRLTIVGSPGTNGTNGATWLSGAGGPLPPSGSNGDFHLDTTNGDVYKKVLGVWGVVGNIAGPTGPTGATGAPGAPGTVVTVDVTFPVAPSVGDLHIQPFTGNASKKFPASWALQWPIGQLLRYGLAPGGSNDLLGPGWLTDLVGAGTVTDIQSNYGPAVQLDVLTTDQSIGASCTFTTDGVTEFEAIIRFVGSSAATTYVWFGLFAAPPTAASDAGCGHFGVRYNETLADAGWTLTMCNDALTVLSTEVIVDTGASPVAPVAGTDYIFRFRIDRPATRLKCWLYDTDYNQISFTEIIGGAAAFPAAGTARNFITFIGDAVGTGTLAVYKMAINR